MKVTSLTNFNVAGKVLTGALVLGLALGAQAQPGAGGGGGQGGNRPNFQNMTPEQRQQFMQQMEERRNQQRQDWLKQAMTASGITDAAAQTAVIDYMTEQAKTKATLQEMAHKLSTSLTTTTTTDDALKTELKAFRDAVAEAKKAKETALATLDTQVKYTTSPRAETFLTLVGALGDETQYLGGIGEVFPDSPYGARGGGFGGRGGQGGGGFAGGAGGGGFGGFGGGGFGGGAGGRGGRGGRGGGNGGNNNNG